MPSEQVKMKIEAYKKVSKTGELTESIGSFTAMFNPQVLNFKTEADFEVSKGTDIDILKYKSFKPQTYDFEFIIDGTGTSGNIVDISVTGGKSIHGDGQEAGSLTDEMPIIDRIGSLFGNSSSQSTGTSDPNALYQDKRAVFVSDVVALFNELTMGYVSETHSTPILKLSWGPLKKTVILKTLDVNYDLFCKEGGPLRARLKCNFLEFVSIEQIQASLKPSSPDMTHRRIVLDGETLPLMTKRIYGDPRYYLEIARVNNLSNFRTLKAGQLLIFPPLDKLN